MHTKNKKQIARSKFQTVVFGVLFFFIGISMNAQCAMCRAALGGDSNIKKAEAVNNGIVYLMVIPYLLVLVIGVLIYRMYRSKKKKAV
jgi:Na+/H+ antiporter NhaC